MVGELFLNATHSQNKQTHKSLLVSFFHFFLLRVLFFDKKKVHKATNLHDNLVMDASNEMRRSLSTIFLESPLLSIEPKCIMTKI